MVPAERVRPAAVAKVAPELTVRLPVIAKLDTWVVETVPLTVKLPPIVVVAVCKISVPLPLNIKL